jgi:hypothetical protein
MTTRSPRTIKPAVAKKPFDLDAVEAEALGEPFPFTFGGREYVLPHVQDMDRKVLLAADQGEQAAMEELFRTGLGADFEEFDRQPMKLRTLEALFRNWLEHCGLEPGELRASTSS